MRKKNGDLQVTGKAKAMPTGQVAGTVYISCMASDSEINGMTTEAK
jgi:hypothetical protein